MCPLVSEVAAHNSALAGYNVFRAVVVDVALQVEAQNVDCAEGARCETVGAQVPLVLLEVLLHQRNVAVLAAHGIVQTTLVPVFLGDVQAAVARRTLDRGVFAVQHDMVVDVDAVVDPVAAGLAVGAPDDELIQHVLDDLGHRPDVSARLDLQAARRARLAAIGLRGPGVLQAVVAEVVLAGQLDGLVEGGVADEADEVAVGRRHVLEGGVFGRDLDDAAAATLRRG